MFTKFTYWQHEAGLDPEFCAFVLSRINWEKTKTVASIHRDDKKVLDETIRKTDVVWDTPDSVIGVFMHAYIKDVNIKAEWNFDITHATEVQIARYKNDGGHYTWHRDTLAPVNGMQRKLSMVVLLNDSSEFEGGKFELENENDFLGLHKAGSIVVFPSYLNHRVTPVTKGTRYTATCWINGPAFR
jgi:PKHD-type hydroxylase